MILVSAEEELLSRVLLLPISLISPALAVDSIWTCEKLGLPWIALDIFPARIRPSTWHKFQIISKSHRLVMFLKIIS